MRRLFDFSARAAAIFCFAVIGACGGSAAQRCRAGAAFQQDPIARELALNRCEQIADREHADRTRQEELQRAEQEEAAREAEVRAQADRVRIAEVELQRRNVRKNPNGPELRSTPNESAAICGRQGGEQSSKSAASEDGTTLICRVGAAPIYIGFVAANEETISALKVFYEGADIAVIRGNVEESLGAPTRTAIEKGYRAWIWDQGTPQVDVRSYDQGVAVTFRIAPPTEPTAAATP